MIIDNLLRKLFILCIVAGLTVSCGDDDDDTTTTTPVTTTTELSDSEVQNVQDIASINAEIDNTLNNLNIAQGSQGGRVTTCAEVTYETSPTITVTLDFGDGCTAEDGITRSGKIIASYDFSGSGEGGTSTITYENFAAGGTSYDGSISVIYTDSFTEYSLEISNLAITYDDGTSLNFTANYTYSFTEGFGDADFDNDVLEITGTSSGTTREGVSYSTEITSALVIKTACYASQVYYAVEGITEIIVDGRTYTVDYGDGTCDNTATVSTTILGNTFTEEISLDD